MTDYFEFGFQTGAILAPHSAPYGCELFVFVQNPTGSEKVVRVLGYNTDGQWFDSDVDFDLEAGPHNGKIPPRGLWIYPRRIYVEDPRIVWLTVWATSDQLVPSVHLFAIAPGEGGIPRRQDLVWVAPGDFAVRRNPFKLGQPEVVGPKNVSLGRDL
jgi:hypothetical protein